MAEAHQAGAPPPAVDEPTVVKDPAEDGNGPPPPPNAVQVEEEVDDDDDDDEGEAVGKRGTGTRGGTGTRPGGEPRSRFGSAFATPGPINPRLSKSEAMVERARREREMSARTPTLSPLLISVQRGHDDIVKVLLNHGATS